MADPVTAIVEAKTSSDVIRAMTNNPEVRSEILSAFEAVLTGDKSLFQSKTFWAALITPLVSALAARYLAGLDASTVGAITTVLTSGMMVLMRLVSTTKITSFFPTKQGASS